MASLRFGSAEIPLQEFEDNESFNTATLTTASHFLDFCGTDTFSSFKDLFKSALNFGEYVALARLYARFAFVDRAAAGAFSDEQVVEFIRWCRVCDNLIYNVRIDEIGGLISAIRGMDTLSDNCFDILAALPDIDVRQVSFFRNEQLNEEAEKATLIQEDPDWEPLLLETEHHPYLMGQVGFILELARTEDGKPDQIQFAEKAAKVKYLLTRDILGSREFLLQRALLSIGDYLVGGSFRNFLSATQQMVPSGTEAKIGCRL